MYVFKVKSGLHQERAILIFLVNPIKAFELNMNDFFERLGRKPLVQQNNKLRKFKSRSPLKRLEMSIKNIERSHAARAFSLKQQI